MRLSTRIFKEFPPLSPLAPAHIPVESSLFTWQTTVRMYSSLGRQARARVNRETSVSGLRCRPGDLARVVSAWNPALIGRVVLIKAAHSKTEWVVTLLGEPGVTLTKNRKRIAASNCALAYDSALEPIRAVGPGKRGEVTAVGEEDRRRQQGFAA